ncbi:hypothetical protein [Vreelandella venusta]|uniref:hypothetical protein n=1 Tax=Vreelandella venusta TaxID=44935 RepID=UPI0018DA9E5F|nr:hypothetical protein [Halomonas venusta]QPI64435.1 hypothetical protein IR195_01505 [Halomonas venusta]
MKALIKAARIQQLKNRARRLYIAYVGAHDHLGCGHRLADHITGGRRKRLAKAFNATLDRLETLGENPPKERLL